MITDYTPENLKFRKVTNEVIKRLEGGYYHPNMMKKDPVKFKAYGKSGETMFGLDRHAGHSLFYSTPRLSSDVFENIKNIEGNKYQYKNEAARKFWQTIDAMNAKTKWAWNYIPDAQLADQLRNLASDIIYPNYVKLFNTYLTPEAREIVKNSAPLTFHLSYATWNGSGWFKKFAADINEAVAKGVKKESDLIKVAIFSRTKEGLKKGSTANPLIKQGGEKIATFINDIKFD